MSKQSIVPFHRSTEAHPWDGAKKPLDAVKLMLDQLALVTRSRMAAEWVDHPTRVYIEEPSERLLAFLGPILGLERIEFGGGLVRWKVALSDETDSIDPVHARQVNEYLAEDLQELFWKKDGRVVVDSALRPHSASKVVPLRPA